MHPNSLANLRAPWQPGEKPPPAGPRGLRRIEKALEITQNATPKAARLITRAISDPDLPMTTRIRCAEYVLDKVLPTQKGPEIGILGGAEFLELRFVAPGQQPEPQRMPLIEAEASDINDLSESAEDASDG